jgi:hypothetical protein
MAISDRNLHSGLMIAVVLSTKFLQDELYRNSYFCKVDGIQSVAAFEPDVPPSRSTFVLYHSNANIRAYVDISSYSPSFCTNRG